ncbi:MAG: Threonine ammonia-lyase [Candidatus Roizmanbacteria bacterium GW2011_GWC2_37_13]|uniref:Threonine ammonia-lyase n=1 Tax=Candidatus Roizmanbacteria bacterium GW2011_GWC2_37_13 TaxID=1618486 RepID=A0A0G0GD76_9BACT|nr:MAG: Threonine ammonia-lyase [Candidatus Roizmanbacteria bacterium GW2011_GWC2_37_13]KKQ24551.1 MAG: Threonine ammonia-lyase [Candidatus Roizmanbacteria bacterium GW2011_GWC1_37_12]
MKNLFKQIEEAVKNLEGSVKKTPLQFSQRLSDLYQANIYLKREDLQEVRSYKIRGALNKMMSLTEKEKSLRVVTASAGNHGQGVAFSCNKLKVKGVIFMPRATPNQKVERVKYFGNGQVEIKLEGDTYDEAVAAAKKYSQRKGAVYVPAFDDEKVIAGQGTVAKEVYDQLKGDIDYVLVPIGGGGLISGVSVYLKEKNKNIRIVGVEAKGGNCMIKSFKAGKIVSLDSVDTFCDGCAVKTPGKLTFEICKKLLHTIMA